MTVPFIMNQPVVSEADARFLVDARLVMRTTNGYVLTRKGSDRARAEHWQTNSLIASWLTYQVPVGAYKLQSVTGVTKIDDSHACVAFTYLAAPNDLGRALLKYAYQADVSNDLQTNGWRRMNIRKLGSTMNSVAHLMRGDDGWYVARVGQVDLRGREIMPWSC